MKSEDLKELLKNPLLNSAAFAAKMYPSNKPVSAKIRLHNKLNDNVSGSGKQRLTDDDLVNASGIFKEFAELINSKL